MALVEPKSLSTDIVLSKAYTDALLFDLDGTIIDSMPHHHLAWQELLREIGHDWTLKQVKDVIWGKNEEIFERVFPGRFTTEEARALSHQKELRYIEFFKPHIKMLDGLEALLVKAKAAEFRLAIATAAPRVCVDFAYEALGLDRYFEEIVYAEQVTLSKPHPETFLTAARLVNTAPARCIVFEDAPVGVRAAEAAEMHSYVLLTTHKREEFDPYHSVRGFMNNYCGVDVTADASFTDKRKVPAS